MVYMVTGGAGFIGVRVARDLLRQGDIVVLYDTSPHVESLKRVIPSDLVDGLALVSGNVLDLAKMIDTAKRYAVKKIIHLAYLLGPDSSDNPLMAIRVNCEGTVNVFETARLLELERVVWASSAGVYGEARHYRESILPNDAPHRPIYIYGACKSLCEFVATHYFTKWGVDGIGLRLTFIYGPDVRRGAAADLFTGLIDKPAMGIPSIVPFGDDTMNLQHVDEASRLLIMAADAPKTSTRVFNTTGEVVRVRDAVGYVRELLPDAEITTLPGLYWGVGVIPRYDTNRLEEEIGFKPRYGLKEGLRRSINEVRAQSGLAPI